MRSWRPHRRRRHPTAFFLAPWGPGTEVLWSTHAERAWESRREDFGASKREVQDLLVRRLPLRPDAWQEDRTGRVNRWVRLPNGRRLLAALETLRVASLGQPGAVELVTLFLDTER